MKNQLFFLIAFIFVIVNSQLTTYTWIGSSNTALDSNSNNFNPPLTLSGLVNLSSSNVFLNFPDSAIAVTILAPSIVNTITIGGIYLGVNYALTINKLLINPNVTGASASLINQSTLYLSSNSLLNIQTTLNVNGQSKNLGHIILSGPSTIDGSSVGSIYLGAFGDIETDYNLLIKNIVIIVDGFIDFDNAFGVPTGQNLNITINLGGIQVNAQNSSSPTNINCPTKDCIVQINAQNNYLYLVNQPGFISTTLNFNWNIINYGNVSIFSEVAFFNIFISNMINRGTIYSQFAILNLGTSSSSVIDFSASADIKKNLAGGFIGEDYLVFNAGNITLGAKSAQTIFNTTFSVNSNVTLVTPVSPDSLTLYSNVNIPLSGSANYPYINVLNNFAAQYAAAITLNFTNAYNVNNYELYYVVLKTAKPITGSINYVVNNVSALPVYAFTNTSNNITFTLYCNPGSEASSNNLACDLCPPGTENPNVGSSCTTCPKNTFTSNNGTLSCTTCSGAVDAEQTTCQPSSGSFLEIKLNLFILESTLIALIAFFSRLNN